MKKPRGMDEKGRGEGNGGIGYLLLGCLVVSPGAPGIARRPLGEAACRFYAVPLYFTLAT